MILQKFRDVHKAHCLSANDYRHPVAASNAIESPSTRPATWVNDSVRRILSLIDAFRIQVKQTASDSVKECSIISR